jgi:hypothetical protein
MMRNATTSKNRYAHTELQELRKAWRKLPTPNREFLSASIANLEKKREARRKEYVETYMHIERVPLMGTLIVNRAKESSAPTSWQVPGFEAPEKNATRLD